MNKKLLICGAIATGLLVTACVKKEAPKEEEQVEVSAASENESAEATKFENLEPTEQQAPEADIEVVENQRENQAEAVTPAPEPKREPATQAAPTNVEKPAVEKAPVEKLAQASTPKVNTGAAQSEDDAVADAIAAATPALNN
ncbi:hypothetical protein A3K93_06505 [Acinetobacter sp. NCu2D-2]|uniref:hypothetical protein n=1 Tax=Acinetobacter sp. NCu2D-2 TaxID=1608473 RepID=UPI0007CDC0C6|nr:hypothetical protein [Acinetobacter sp. NCu2D-2]ANF81876.1 hypothetical protein A3K93_06505 [Acinetobacter sp. NCu2D-2]